MEEERPSEREREMKIFDMKDASPGEHSMGGSGVERERWTRSREQDLRGAVGRKETKT